MIALHNIDNDTKYPYMKISFCTTVRNRLYHLKETLPDNMREVRNHDAELVLLDYGSTDGLEEWITSAFAQDLSSGKLRRFRYSGASYFDRSHSKNLTIKLSDGDVVCNIDADNYIGAGFCEYLISVFSPGERVFISGLRHVLSAPDSCGKICGRKSDFLSVGGYDENFEGHGFEDYDFSNRLQLLGLRELSLDHPEFRRAISHSNLERVQEDRLSLLTHRILIADRHKPTATVIVLMNNGWFLCCKVVDTRECGQQSPFRYQLDSDSTRTGTWSESGCHFTTFNEAPEVYERIVSNDQISYVSNQGTFQEVGVDDLPDIILFLAQIMNRYRATDNFTRGRIKPNETFGSGTVLHIETSRSIAV